MPPILHVLANSYYSRVDQPVQCLFLAISALLNHKIYVGDATDAYAYSPADFKKPTFVSINDPPCVMRHGIIQNWIAVMFFLYRKRYKGIPNQAIVGNNISISSFLPQN